MCENGEDIVWKEVIGYFLKIKTPHKVGHEFKKLNPTEVVHLPF